MAGLYNKPGRDASNENRSLLILSLARPEILPTRAL